MEKTIHESSGKKHILLTGLGMLKKTTEYLWNGKKTKAELTPLALVQLLDKSQLPNHVIGVVTAGAKRETWQTFRAGICNTLKFSPELVEIPNGNNADELRQILESVANRIPEGADLTLDVTQGFRHFPFIFYALVLYLKSLREVNIRGAYYGMVEGIPQDEPKPIIDLQPLLKLPEWFHAVRMFRDQGTTTPMAQLLQPLANTLTWETGQLFKDGKKKEGAERSEQAKQVRGSVDWLERYAFAYESALPLELEKASRGLIDSIKGLPTIGSTGRPPLVGELTKNIVSAAKETAFTVSPSSKGKWKQHIRLDKDELNRQAYMIDLYLDRDQLSLAIGLMREWVVSWAIWKSDNCKDIKNWLELDVRELYSKELGAIGAAARGEGATSTLTSSVPEGFGNFWNQLTIELRNALLHNAMRIESVEEPPKSLQSVQKFWNTLKSV